MKNTNPIKYYLQEKLVPDAIIDARRQLFKAARKEIGNSPHGLINHGMVGGALGGLAGGIYNKFVKHGSFKDGAIKGGLIGAGLGAGTGLIREKRYNKKLMMALKKHSKDSDIRELYREARKSLRSSE